MLQLELYVCMWQFVCATECFLMPTFGCKHRVNVSQDNCMIKHCIKISMKDKLFLITSRTVILVGQYVNNLLMQRYWSVCRCIGGNQSKFVHPSIHLSNHNALFVI